MHLKRTMPFNEKPRTRAKKAVAENTQSECLKFSFDNHGNLKDVMTKTHGWVSLSLVNKWHLLKVQSLLVEKGEGDSQAYKAIWAEIDRRITLGEITPADTASEKRPAA
jgi:hypothetical protein